jgi:hypothetical protein
VRPPEENQAEDDERVEQDAHGVPAFLVRVALEVSPADPGQHEKVEHERREGEERTRPSSRAAATRGARNPQPM